MNTSNPVRWRRGKQQAFTLLEVILTLSMSVVLMVLIGGAVQFYSRDMNVRDMDIRQTQLAAAIMQMIEDDLRATLYTEPVDTAPLEALLSGAAGGGSAAQSSSDLSAAGIGSEAGLESGLVTSDIQMGVAVLTKPGLIGNQFQVQVDVSRLPRLEEYVAMLDQSTANLDDIPSDIKTVAYFVQGAGELGGVQDVLGSFESPTDGSQTGGQTTGGLSNGGLVRRSLDRAATVQASSTGGLSMLNQTGELLAPEIVAIEFSYWDGLMWQLQWSSDEFGGLPLAVQVQLTLRDERLGATDSSQLVSTAGPTGGEMRVFRHVVRLPLARPIDMTSQSTVIGTGL